MSLIAARTAARQAVGMRQVIGRRSMHVGTSKVASSVKNDHLKMLFI